MRHRRKAATKLEMATQVHYGNGNTITFSDVLNYFKGKPLEVREQAIEAIRATTGWTKMPGRPSLKKLDPETHV